MIYRCSVCGYVFDEEKEGRSFSELTECPVCRQPADRFDPVKESAGDMVQVSETAPVKVDRDKGETPADGEIPDLNYPAETRKTDSDYRYMKYIHEIAVTGSPVIEAMGTRMPMPDWDDILILGAQLNPPPLDEHAPVSTMTVIGKNAKRPMILGSPVYISHMSFGALSRETKIALAKGSAMAKTAMCSGEGGILPGGKGGGP